jgi:hypothetical protein
MFYMNIIERIVYIALLVLLIIIAIKAFPVLGALIRFLMPRTKDSLLAWRDHLH